MEYSYSSRKRLKFLLSGAFESAVDNDFCDKNPVRRAEIAIKAQVEKEAFTEDETRTIINFAKYDKSFGITAFIMLNTGIRSGEMRALAVDKIDFKKGIVTIDTAVKANGELGKPKNGKTRYIPIKPEVARFLDAKIDKRLKYVVGERYLVSSPSFGNKYLRFFGRLNQMLESAGAEQINPKSPHSFRHTYSSLLQKNGMPIAMVSELLGHSSTNITDKYTHLSGISVLSEAINKYALISQLA
jgi:integrase